MEMEKDTYKYKVMRNGKIVEKGTTLDLKRKAASIKARFPDAVIKQVGRKTTRQEANVWFSKVALERTIEIASIPTKNYKEVIEIRVPTRFYWNEDDSFDGIEFGAFQTILQPWEEDMARRCLEAIGEIMSGIDLQEA